MDVVASWLKIHVQVRTACGRCENCLGLQLTFSPAVVFRDFDVIAHEI